jgi:hypothetical protein
LERGERGAGTLGSGSAVVTRKKFRMRVLPGVWLTLARLLRFNKELISEDLPTFDRPTKAISGRRSWGNCSGLSQLLTNSAEMIFIADPGSSRS